MTFETERTSASNVIFLLSEELRMYFDVRKGTILIKIIHLTKGVTEVSNDT